MDQSFLKHPALLLFEDLLAVPSPSGREEGVAQVVRDKLAAWGYEPETDGAGNVLVRLAGKEPGAPLCCIASHLDEIAMVVTQIEADGSLRVDRSGGLHPWKIGEGPVEIVGDGETLVGVFSMGSGHVSGAGDKPIGWDDVRVITGLSFDQLEAAGVRPGSTAVPVRERRGPVLFGDETDPLVAAWTFDDRMGIVALLRLLETVKVRRITPYAPTIVAFTVHEEGGAHGAKVLTQRERPGVFVAIDGCPMPPGSGLQLDGRPGIWSKDSLTHFDQRLVHVFRQAAERAGTELQVAVYDAAASDASYVYAAGGAERVATMGHPRENSHGYEVARLSVFDNVWRTLVAFVEDWQGE